MDADVTRSTRLAVRIVAGWIEVANSTLGDVGIDVVGEVEMICSFEKKNSSHVAVGGTHTCG